MLLLVGCLCLVLGAAAADAQVVDIPDPALREAIAEALGKSPGTLITVDDMLTLRSLDRWKWGGGSGPDIRDLTGLEFATNLERLRIAHNSVSDLSPLAGLTRLYYLYLGANSISDISPLAGLTSLRTLLFYANEVSDISPLAGLTNLDFLNFAGNSISDLSPLSRLTKLEYLKIDSNSFSDLSPLEGLTKLETLYLRNNPISDLLPLTGLTKLEILYLDNNSISDLSPLVANRGLGAGDTIIIVGNPLSDISINRHIPTLRIRGVTVHNTKLSIPAVKRTNVGDTFTLDIIVEDVVDLAGWQIDIVFNPQVLGAVSVAEGDFLSKDGGNTLFLQGTINNVSGTITGVNQVFLGDGGVSGTGKLLSITFEAKATGRERLRLHNLSLGSANGDNIPYALVTNPIITVGASRDINGDGSVNISDLILVSQNLGSSNPQADINNDGEVNIFDLIAVAQYLDESTTNEAPTIRWNADLHSLHSETIQGWIDMAHVVDDGSLAFQLGIANLKCLLAAIIPEKTALLANYPNPFNPETWIPYHLANDTDVMLTIYDIKGSVVRQFSLGYHQAGYYTDRTKAAYWDGRNEHGESVASGAYFYQLQTGDYSAMRKMVILK